MGRGNEGMFNCCALLATLLRSIWGHSGLDKMHLVASWRESWYDLGPELYQLSSQKAENPPRFYSDATFAPRCSCVDAPA